MQVRAAAAGHADIVSVLRHHVPELAVHVLDVTADAGPLAGHTALSAAAKAGHVRVVAGLLTQEPPADVHRGPFHGAALIQAAEAGHGHVVDLLLHHGCDPDCHLQVGCQSALCTAAHNEQWPVCAVRCLPLDLLTA